MQELLSWISGDLSPQARVWTALAPAILASAYFIIGFLIFVVRTAIYGVPEDKETISRGATVLVGFYLRHYFFWLVSPILRFVLWTGLPANAITAASALIGVASGVAVAMGRFALGGWLFLISGILDVFDGRVARARKESTPAGAAIDSILDRYTDTAMLMGLAWYYRDRWVLFPVLLAILGSSLVPYVRARGEGLGIQVRGGAMQRLERVLYLGGSVTLSPILEAILFPNDQRPMHWLAVAGLCFLAVTSNYTALTRFFGLVKALTPKEMAKTVKPSPTFLTAAATASVVATVIDFGIVQLLASKAGMTLTAATFVGCLIGAVIHFSMHLALTLRGNTAKGAVAARYFVVALVGAALNAGGVALLAALPGIDPRLAWAITRSAVHLVWNLPLHRDYVFSPAQSAKLEPRHAG